MPKYAEKPIERVCLKSRPQKVGDRKKLRELISERYSKTLEYLAK